MADKLTIEILAKNLTGRAFRAIGSGLRRLGQLGKRTFTNITRTAKTGLKVMAAGVIAFAVSSIKAAKDAEAVESKFKAVFKELSNDVEKWSIDFSKSVGRASVDIREMLAGVQDLFVPMGIARKEAAELSKEIVKLAVDVASFNGKADKDVINDFKSALVGSSETVRKYGVVLTEANVAQEAVALGLAKSAKKVSDAAKIQARLSLIVKGTTDAHGNAKDTAGELENVMKRLRSAMRDLQREFGVQLIRGLELGRNFKELGDRFVEWTDKLRQSKAIETWARRAREALAPLSDIMKAIFSGDEKKREIAVQGIKDLGTQLAKSALELLIDGGSMIGEAIWNGFKTAWSKKNRLTAQAKAELTSERKAGQRAGVPLTDLQIRKGSHNAAAVAEKVREIRARQATGPLADILMQSRDRTTLQDVVVAINAVPEGNQKKLAAQ